MTKHRILVLVGGKFHPFAECGAIVKEFVEATGRYDLMVTEDWEMLRAESISGFSAVIAYTQGGSPTAEQLAGLLGYVRAGGGFVGLHGASATWKECAPYHDMLGCAFAGHGPVSEFAVTIVPGASPITQDIPDFRIEDELYLVNGLDPADVDVLATAELDGRTHPMAYTKSYGAGRIFYLALGHDQRAFHHAIFRALVVGGLEWSVETAAPRVSEPDNIPSP